MDVSNLLQANAGSRIAALHRGNTMDEYRHRVVRAPALKRLPNIECHLKSLS